MGKVIARWLHGRYHKPRRMIPSINETLSISARLHGHHSPRFCIFIAAAGAKIFMLRSMCALARVEFRVIRRGSGSASISGFFRKYGLTLEPILFRGGAESTHALSGNEIQFDVVPQPHIAANLSGANIIKWMRTQDSVLLDSAYSSYAPRISPRP